MSVGSLFGKRAISGVTTAGNIRRRLSLGARPKLTSQTHYEPGLRFIRKLPDLPSCHWNLRFLWCATYCYPNRMGRSRKEKVGWLCMHQTQYAPTARYNRGIGPPCFYESQAIANSKVRSTVRELACRNLCGGSLLRAPSKFSVTHCFCMPHALRKHRNCMNAFINHRPGLHRAFKYDYISLQSVGYLHT